MESNDDYRQNRHLFELLGQNTTPTQPDYVPAENAQRPATAFSSPSTRTVSRDGSGPMHTPMPDQPGTHASNIERLEESAARMSMSSDIGYAIRQLCDEQKRSESRRSSILRQDEQKSSHSRRSSGRPGSPAFFRSVSARQQHLIGHEGSSSSSPRSSLSRHSDVAHPLRSELATTGTTDGVINRSILEDDDVFEDKSHGDADDAVNDHSEAQSGSDSPAYRVDYDTRTSTETARQRESLFIDFDGVHTSGEGASMIERPSSVRSTEPAIAPDMVFYPAPVPMVLNLPKRLSRMPPNPLPRLLSDLDDNRKSKMPPQLRATMYFEHDSVGQTTVEIKDQSAVATLDSILDAAAYAPVSAFTDHPIAGSQAGNVYGRAMSRRASTTLLADGPKRNSLMSLGTFLTRRKSASRLSVDMSAADQEEVPEDMPPDEQPTTLLAELAMRKAEQKSRNRAAATAFPDGMHATLLELDAVAQVQRSSRNKKPTKLAWEEPGEDEGDPQKDDEVPLGMLFDARQEQIRRDDEERPLGLIAKRIIEDNEPLTHRRARLRGEAIPVEDVAHESDDEDAEETLGARLRRLKATRIAQPAASNDFASEVISHLESLGQMPGEEEQKESLADCKKKIASTNQRHSMASILQAHPLTQSTARLMPNEQQYAPPAKSRNSSWAMHMNQQAGWASQMYNAANLARPVQFGGAGWGQGAGFAGYATSDKVLGMESELRQRDMVDQWRQSVMR